MRLAAFALLALGCSGGTFSAEDAKGGEAGMAGSAAGLGGSAGESPQGGAGMASGGSPAGQGGTAAGSAGEAAGGPATGGAGMGGESAAGGLGGAVAGQGGVAGDVSPAGMGGIAGAGAEQCGLPYGSPGYKAIDGLDDGDGVVGNGEDDPDPPARHGIWSAGNSSPGLCLQTAGPLTPEDDGAGNLAVTTSGFDCAEAWAGFDLHRCGGLSEPYDVSPYSGLTFRYRSSAAVRVVLAMDPGAPMAERHGKNFMAAASWTEATVTWQELQGDQTIGSPPAKPQTSGEPRAFDPEQVTGIWFVTGGEDFELWVDDVAFR